MDIELEIINGLLAELRDRSVVDVGAELGSVSEALLEAGWGPLVLLEPTPESVSHLRQKFAGNTRITVHQLAAGENTRTATFKRAFHGDEQLPGLNSARMRPRVKVDFRHPFQAEVRTLDWLAGEGTIPLRPGLLKVDAEGMEMAVIRGAHTLRPKIMVTEHWLDIPQIHGSAPWSFEEMVSAAAEMGMHDYVSVVHDGPHRLIELNHCAPAVGQGANVIFFVDELIRPAIREYGKARRKLAKQDWAAAHVDPGGAGVDAPAPAPHPELEPLREAAAERERLLIRADGAARRLRSRVAELEQERADQNEAAGSAPHRRLLRAVRKRLPGR